MESPSEVTAGAHRRGLTGEQGTEEGWWEAGQERTQVPRPAALCLALGDVGHRAPQPEHGEDGTSETRAAGRWRQGLGGPRSDTGHLESIQMQTGEEGDER